MSSKIRIERICQQCGESFIAQTTVTKYCGNRCAKRAYKARKRNEKIETAKRETLKIKTKSIEEIQAREFLTAKEVAQLLGCSIRTVYYKIECGEIKAVNLGQRLTRIRRSEIDRIFETVEATEEIRRSYEISECYSLKDLEDKYGISSKAIYDIANKYRMTKVRKGKYLYLPKEEIHEYLGL